MENFSNIPPDENETEWQLFFTSNFVIDNVSSLFPEMLVETTSVFLSTVFGLQIFPEDVYFLDEMPSELTIKSILSISIFSLITTALASLFPSIAVSKIEPVKALKYE